MRLPRFRVDDRELEQEIGVKPADHQFSTLTANSEAVGNLERKMLGPAWFKPRKKNDERS